jgi:hypothetical protein
MAKLAMQFEAVGGEKHVVRVQDVKWAYQSGSDYFIEWLDPRINQWRQAEITSGSYAAIDQLVTVSAQNFGDTPVVGSVKINPHAITLANNVGGLDVEILTADKLAFVIDTGDWVATNDANAATFSSAAGVANVVGVASPTAGDASTLVTPVAVVDTKVYTLSVEVGEVALGGKEAGTDFELTIAVGATSVELTDADLVEGNVIEIEYTAVSTGNVNVTFRFEAVEEASQTALSIDFTNPTFRRQTGSNQLVGIVDGTMVRYEIGNTPMSLLLTTGVAALVSASDSALVSYVPTTVNGTPWTGGDLAASAFIKFNQVDEIGGGVSVIDLNAQQSLLLIGTTTAIGSLDS